MLQQAFFEREIRTMLGYHLLPLFGRYTTIPGDHSQCLAIIRESGTFRVPTPF